MKTHIKFSSSLMVAVLLVWVPQAIGDQEVTFGFTGVVNSFNRDENTIVVEDILFRISKSTRVHKKRHTIATLSDIRTGTRVGFNPDLGAAAFISDIWILPKNWKTKPGYAVSPDD